VLADRRGLRFESRSREEIEQFLQHGGHFEGAEIDFLSAYLQAGDTAFDIGANVGAFTVPMARSVGADGSVHAFEPLAANVERLRRNLELNEIENVRANPVAVADGRAELELTTFGPGYESWTTTVPRTIPQGSSVLAPQGTISVEATTLDDYCAEHGVERIAALKIDVEGGEPKVIAGAEALLRRRAIDLVVVEVSNNTLPADTPSHELVGVLEEHGLLPHVIDRRRLVPFRAVGHVEFANVVAIRADALERARAAQSRAKA
jgi:FkbM family methyltransferase